MPVYEGGGAQTIIFIFASIAVVFGAYYVTRLVGKRSQLLGQGRTIRVRDRFLLSRNKAIYLIEVQDKVYLIAFSDNSVTLLDSFDTELFHDAEKPITTGFSEVWRAITKRRDNNGEIDTTGAGKRNDETDDIV